MTCDQFDELWRRLESTPLVAGELRIAATASELLAFERHSHECVPCHDKCEARWEAMQGRYTAEEKALLNGIASLNVSRIEEQRKYDGELP